MLIYVDSKSVTTNKNREEIVDKVPLKSFLSCQFVMAKVCTPTI